MIVNFVDLSRQYKALRDEIIDKIDEISYSGNYVLGSEVEKAEKALASYCGTKFAVGVGNGSDALFLSMKALGIGAGDEVITAPNSFIASAWTIAATGATPVFADISKDLNINVQEIEKYITPKTKAIMPVHFTGKMANMDVVLDIAKQHNVYVIEDAAQAIGATYKNQKAGSLGDVGCFSLHPLKILHVHGDGGFLTTNNETLYKRVKQLRNHGLKNRDNCVEWGYNSRLDSIQAAIVCIKLNYLDDWIDRIREIAFMYNKELKGLVEVPIESSFERQVYHRYMIKVDNRDAVQSKLDKRNIQTKVNYPIPIHLQDIGIKCGYKQGDFPETENAANHILSLPIYPELSDKEVAYTIKNIKSVMSV